MPGNHQFSGEALVKYFDLFLKVSTVVALLSVALLGTKFVTKDEFKENYDTLSSRVGKIEQVLIRMEANAETDKRHDVSILDHENRIRALERQRQEYNP
jgi:hypothetical protein